VNLFFATRPGQIRNIATYVSQAGRVNNRLVVLTTENEDRLRPKLAQAIPPGLFEYIGWPILPGAPSERKGVFRRVKVYRVFESAIDEALAFQESVACVRVHLFHPSAYYPYVLRILARRGVEVVGTVMLEEGISTYKWCALPYEIDTYGRVAGVHGARDAVVEIKDALMPPQLRFGILEHFDEGWFRFPDAMANARQVSFGCLKHLEPNPIPMLDERLMPLVEGAPKALFVGQRFGDCRCSIETTLALLELLGCTEVLYKVHPMESADVIDETLRETSTRNCKVRVCRLPALDDAPVEALIATGHFSVVVGLTSTALVYASQDSTNTRFISMAWAFLELYPLFYERQFGCEMPAGHLRQLQRDAEVFGGIVEDVEMLGKRRLDTCL